MTYSAALAGLLRQISGNDKFEEQLRKKDPIFARMKMKSITGEPLLHVETGRSPGGSATGSVAKANASLAARTKFVLSPGRDFQALSLSDYDLKGAREPGAIKSLMEAEKDTAERSIADSLSMGLYRDGHGVRGNIATGGISSATITLANPRDALNFFEGMKVVFSELRGGALRDSGATLTVLRTDPSAGTVTFTANVSTISGVVAGDFIYRHGDAAAGGTRKLFIGAQGWFADPASDGGAFYGVTRTNFSRHTVAGTVSNQASTVNTYDKLYNGIEAILAASGNGGSNNKVLAVPSNYFLALAKEADNRNVVVDKASKGEFGHRRMVISFGSADVEVVLSYHCVADQAVLFDMDMVELWYLGDKMVAPMVIDDSAQWQLADGENWQCQYSSYCVLAPKAPSTCGRIVLA